MHGATIKKASPKFQREIFDEIWTRNVLTITLCANSTTPFEHKIKVYDQYLTAATV
jgi:hypothetical protein